MKERFRILLSGIVRENPVWVLVLGTCPTLATTSTVFGGIGMGLSVLFVLMGSNLTISALKNVIPDKVRIPCYIVLIAGFVTVISLILQGFLPELYQTLGIYLPLIVVNCIILARAEAFASKNNVFNSLLDALGMGIGFTLALGLLGSFRELFGNGTWLGLRVIPESFAIPWFTTPSGGFVAFGLLMAVVASLSRRPIKKKTCTDCRHCNKETS